MVSCFTTTHQCQHPTLADNRYFSLLINTLKNHYDKQRSRIKVAVP
ncbi:hypothetical protein DAQ1742_02759 [Dickeya aquatica]|uniref:Uncharacterized protein n=1 Tax=Dickeya aquatica TaxID=1401087 RepID=A0A375ACG8_9GAMM|nr:hypothetical protein DAQ1742_02759 [Dickeya aquatica]